MEALNTVPLAAAQVKKKKKVDSSREPQAGNRLWGGWRCGWWELMSSGSRQDGPLGQRA